MTLRTPSWSARACCGSKTRACSPVGVATSTTSSSRASSTPRSCGATSRTAASVGRRERGTRRARRRARGHRGRPRRRSSAMLAAATARRFLATPSYRVLADDKVRCTGEPLAIVVAETRALAEDACELVDVDIEPLPPVVRRSSTRSTRRARRCSTSSAPTSCTTGRTVTATSTTRSRARTGSCRSHFTQERMANVPLEGRAMPRRLPTPTRTSW